MMARKTLTAAAVRNYQPGKARREIPDAGCSGLHLIVQPNGRKSWAMRFRRPDGRPAKLTLGPVDMSGKELEGERVVRQPLTLAAARRLAAEIQRQRGQGKDVAADRKSAIARQSSSSTFGAATREFIENHAKKKNRRWRETARLLGLRPDGELIKDGISDRWSGRPISEITSHEIFDVADEVRRRGVPGLERRSAGLTDPMARRMHACLSRMFSWLIQNRKIERNPCAGLHRPEVSRARERVLSDDELRWFLTASGELGYPVGPLLKVLVLTGQRVGEVAKMMRSELGEDDGGRPIWTLLAARTKNKREHIVPLPPAVHEIVGEVRQVEGGPGYVFTTNGRAASAVGSKVKRHLDARMAELAGRPVAPWRIHDLRRTMASGLQRLGVPLPVTEKVLGHAGGSFAGIVGVYQVHEYSEEKRDALEKWATHVAALQAPNLVSMRRGA